MAAERGGAGREHLSRATSRTCPGRYDGPALLVACGRSAYVQEEDRALMSAAFLPSGSETIPQADHWPHISAPAELEKALREFLSCDEQEFGPAHVQ